MNSIWTRKGILIGGGLNLSKNISPPDIVLYNPETKACKSLGQF